MSGGSPSSVDLRRRRVLVAGASFVLSVGARMRAAGAAMTEVPVDLQVELFAKVARHDRNMERRAVGGQLRVLIARMGGSVADEREAEQLHLALRALPHLAGLPHQTKVVEFSNAPALAQTVGTGGVAVVYLTGGLATQAQSIGAALAGTNALSVSARPEAVDGGVVLGFDLRQGRPKVRVNLPQARSQHVAFRASLLKIVEVVG